MVILYSKTSSQKRFKKVKTFRNYDKAWSFVASKLIKLDYRLSLSYSLQYLTDGYSNRRVFPYASHEISRKGVVYKIAI
jgi:hypothetical protein